MQKLSLVYPLQSFNYQPKDSYMVSGEGMYLYDDNGKKYIDAISGLWNVPFGHCNPIVNDAIGRQLKMLPYANLYSYSTPISQKYAEMLLERFHGDFSRLIYTCSGSECNECAIKTVRKMNHILKYNTKKQIAIFDMSYHGTTYGAMSASGMDVTESDCYAPVVGGFVTLNTPFTINGKLYAKNEEYYLADIDSKLTDDVAAILMEPVIGSGGIIAYPEWYMNALKQKAKEKGILFIFDEVATGFGRTGTLAAYMQMSITPDVICFAKGIDNGEIPFGAVLLSNRVAKVYEENDAYIEHFSTQNGNPLACAAALSVLDIVQDESLFDTIRNKGTYLLSNLKERLQDISCVREVRGNGLMVGIDLVDREGNPITFQKDIEIEHELKRKGLIIYPFSLEKITTGFSLFPYFYITEREIDRIISIIEKVLRGK